MSLFRLFIDLIKKQEQIKIIIHYSNEIKQKKSSQSPEIRLHEILVCLERHTFCEELIIKSKNDLFINKIIKDTVPVL